MRTISWVWSGSPCWQRFAALPRNQTCPAVLHRLLVHQPSSLLQMRNIPKSGSWTCCGGGNAFSPTRTAAAWWHLWPSSWSAKHWIQMVHSWGWPQVSAPEQFSMHCRLPFSWHLQVIPYRGHGWLGTTKHAHCTGESWWQLEHLACHSVLTLRRLDCFIAHHDMCWLYQRQARKTCKSTE